MCANLLRCGHAPAPAPWSNRLYHFTGRKKECGGRKVGDGSASRTVHSSERLKRRFVGDARSMPDLLASVLRELLLPWECTRRPHRGSTDGSARVPDVRAGKSRRYSNSSKSAHEFRKLQAVFRVESR